MAFVDFTERSCKRSNVLPKRLQDSTLRQHRNDHFPCFWIAFLGVGIEEDFPVHARVHPLPMGLHPRGRDESAIREHGPLLVVSVEILS